VDDEEGVARCSGNSRVMGMGVVDRELYGLSSKYHSDLESPRKNSVLALCAPLIHMNLWGAQLVLLGYCVSFRQTGAKTPARKHFIIIITGVCG